MTFRIPREDRQFPESLRHIQEPPLVLWGEGDVSVLENEWKVAIVGARRCSAYGRGVAFRLAEALASKGVTVISGFAEGIDAEAHRGALAGGGKTIAVLGCGLDQDYPVSNRALRKKILASGALITEFEKGTTPAPWTFPQRNRIISGLSRGVVVVEAGLKSGSLITARWAADQGRDVFAVPGPVDSVLSAGTHRLLKEGAKLVTDVEDILEELPPGSGRGQEFGRQAPPFAQQIDRLMEVLPAAGMSVDQLAAASGLAVEDLLVALTELEIARRVRVDPGGIYRKVPADG